MKTIKLVLVILFSIAIASCGGGGTNGTNGTDGTNGTGCTVVDNGDGTYTVTCGGVAVIVSDPGFEPPAYTAADPIAGGTAYGKWWVTQAAGAGTLPILLGVEALKRKGGTMVVQGEMADFPNFPIGKMTVKFITLRSARGHSYKACELALQQLASHRFPLEKVTTHAFGLKDVDLAIRSVGGHGVPDVIHASLMPWK